MHTRTETLLNRSDGALDFADVAVGSDDVDMDGVDGIPDACEFVVAKDGGNTETA